MTLFVAGLLVAGYLVAAGFFLRFWRQTGDRLFAFFASAFILLALQRAALAASPLMPFDVYAYYIPRLLAFVLIIVAIVAKNRSARA